nr:MAG TPA: hypothetical protein [Caudoviricetes sp.]
MILLNLSYRKGIRNKQHITTTIYYILWYKYSF